MKTRLLQKILFCTLILTIILTSTVTTFAEMSNFSESNNYPGFKDVSSNTWYYSDVNKSCKLGLFSGYPSGIFSPNGNITLAEVIKVAVAVRAIYDGDTQPTNSATGNWYDGYISFAIEKGIIESNDFADYKQKAKRNEIAYIFSRALPSTEYDVINNYAVSLSGAVPDVIFEDDAFNQSPTKYASEILTLYAAGILRGDDDYGTFRPNDNIKRSEVAAIINRVAIKQNRLTFFLTAKTIKRTEAEIAAYIRWKIDNTPEEDWIGRPLDDEEKVILENIKADPRNSYPEFLAQDFDYMMDIGYSHFPMYTNWVMYTIMFRGDFEKCTKAMRESLY